MFFHEAPDNGRPSNSDIRKAGGCVPVFYQFVDSLLGLPPEPSDEPVPLHIERMRRYQAELERLNAPAGPPKPSVVQVVSEVVAEVVEAVAPARTSQLAAAQTWLLERIAAGPVAATVLDQLAAEAGIAARTLQRARRKLGLKPKRMHGRMWWLLPDYGVRQDRQLRAGEVDT